MGNEKSSPSVNEQGDGDLTIINNQETHTELHQAHEFKLWLIVIMVAIMLTIQIYKIIAKHEQKKVMQKAKSVAALDIV